jgi:two-component system, OmpR family, phosphate regulon sensor histidine kinase PhoR
MTIGSPMFRKLLLTSLLLILVAVVVLDFLLTRYTAQHETLNVESQLAAQARILATEVAQLSPRELGTWVAQAKGRAGARITLIAPDGKVLADSDRDAETMENHAGRPEVQSAVQGKPGSAVRHSASVNRNLLYLALPAAWQGRGGHILRLAVPLEQVDSAIAEVRWRILQVSLVAALFSLVVAYVLSSSLSRRIQQVQTFAEGLVAARFTSELPPGPLDEIGALGRSLNAMAGQLRDMWERLRVESTRRETILASMVEGVLAVDHELCITFCNAAFCRAVRADYPVAERLPVLELVRDPLLLNMLTRVLVSGEPQRERLELAAAQGRTFEVQAAPLELRSGRGAIAILHDVTDLERLERVRKDFVANVSHELRTPLAAIQGYAETLLDGGLEDQEHNRQFIEIIKAHSVRLNNIAADLLALSELESGDAGPAPERVSVQDAVEAAIATVESEALLRKVQVHHTLLSDECISGRKMRVEQVLVNLLDNAVKFNRPGGEVWIEAARVEGGQVRISVSDSGIGIPSEDLPRVFERFYRVDRARSRAAGGTGLGLSIVKHAVERMGGSITAESQLGKGSKFTVSLPVA